MISLSKMIKLKLKTKSHLPSQTFQFFAVVGVGVARKPGLKPRHVSLTDPTPASVAGNTILLSLLLPHLHTCQKAEAE